MAATQTPHELVASPVPPAAAEILVSLPPLSPDSVQAALPIIAAAFPDRAVVVAVPDHAPGQPQPPSAGLLRVVPFTPAAPIAGTWTLTAADFLNTWKLMQEHKVAAALLLGPEAQSLHAEAMRALAVNALTTDLVTPRYELGPRDGLVNSAILYPVTRALFGTRPRFPLAIDLGLSARIAERLAMVAQRQTAAGANSSLIWPVAEAASAGLTIAEVATGQRALPSPDAFDLNSLLAQVAGSFFADIDAKATFWQRARLAYTPKAAVIHAESRVVETGSSDGQSEEMVLAEAQPMLESFRIAYSNLQEIWSLVLPPNSLLGLKKLSMLSPAGFRMPDALWVRVVYDFVLAWRLRTINRGHLLGALTPLYLAWVASHLLLTSGSGPDRMTPEKHIESLAAAFEADKPYLVSRWRWPDRFNP